MYVLPQTPQSLGVVVVVVGGGLSPWTPHQGSVLEPLGDPKRSPDPSPTHAPPDPKSWIRP